jgi:ATP-dependent DNA helicase DinG
VTTEPRPDPAAELTRLVAHLPGGGEARPGQGEMAVKVAAAIGAGRHLVIRAGTGTGKSLAYLVPAALSDRRVVVATASKALQDQLDRADLPFVGRHLGRPLRWAVLKGRANYLCRQRADEIEAGLGQSELELLGDRDAVRAELRSLLDWAATSARGDRAELAREPSVGAWSALSVSGDECPGAARCPRGGDCFAERARADAAEADVVVVNLALYGVHLGSGERVLPEHDVVVIDECHQLEDVLSSTLGFELGVRRLAALATRTRAVIADNALAAGLVDAGSVLAAALRPHRDERVPVPMRSTRSSSPAPGSRRSPPPCGRCRPRSLTPTSAGPGPSASPRP